ncbi:cytidine deaminase [Maioricimonas rarisocia]|uniref:cytidine deaminase n=1 Tax=Maioricimonas rarisocia TaxID=2528026 RepID=UPI0036F355CF
MTDSGIEKLIAAAWQARENAYCPYSGFAVGAAVLTESGQIYSGCNVENASYGLTICAERASLFQAVAQGERRFTAVAVVTETELPTPPCGACRQVLLEFAPDARVVCLNRRRDIVEYTVRDLLPGAFSAENLRDR